MNQFRRMKQAAQMRAEARARLFRSGNLTPMERAIGTCLRGLPSLSFGPLTTPVSLAGQRARVVSIRSGKPG